VLRSIDCARELEDVDVVERKARGEVVTVDVVAAEVVKEKASAHSYRRYVCCIMIININIIIL